VSLLAALSERGFNGKVVHPVNFNSSVNPKALGSDVARSRRQLLARKVAGAIVSVLRLNQCGFLATEIVQAINPVISIDTVHGPLRCRGGHGRLVWRAQTFHTEEPETIGWLDQIGRDDVYWDIGANVGLYAIYVAKFRGCSVVAFEPEAQNYALLIENLVLNGIGSDRMLAGSLALGDRPGLGTLQVRYLTKGGAYNLFRSTSTGDADAPASFSAAASDQQGNGYRQLIYGATIDDLVFNRGLPAPTHIKIDVDGNEPAIISGCQELLKSSKLRSLLVEINKKSPADLAIVDILRSQGFRVTSDVSVWKSKRERSREHDMPAANMIFSREG
jgi:FkbM family methyltransferase